MTIGTVKEIKRHEYRVGLTPDGARQFITHGHKVLIEKGAGEGSGYEDAAYIEAGARIVPSAADVFAECGMVVKVKEPLPEEYGLIREGQILYAYLHLAANKDLTDALVKSGCTAVAFETITDPSGSLPCLRPMSQIAGRLSVLEGAKYLEKPFGGRGVLLSGVPGVPRANVVILGAGVVGASALITAVGMGADVTILDINVSLLERLEELYHGRISTAYSTPQAVARELRSADLVIGAVLVPGDAAPKLIKRDMLREMKKGSVIVDVAIDQGGCSEASRITYHDDPVFEVDGVLNYCVGNMPGAVSRTSTDALCNATLPYGLRMADMGAEAAMRLDGGLTRGLNIYKGTVAFKAVAELFGYEHVPFK